MGKSDKTKSKNEKNIFCAAKSILTNDGMLKTLKTIKTSNKQKTENKNWEKILSVIINKPTQFSNPKQKREIFAILEFLKILKNGQITEEGKRFLLQNSKTRKWKIIFGYLQRTRFDDNSLIDGLIFILSQNLPQNDQTVFPQNDLNSTQKEIARAFENFGFLESVSVDPSRFCYRPTFVLKNLFSANRKNGFLVVETNFKIYGYTENDVHSFELGLFARINKKLPGFVSASITRESVIDAIKSNLSADLVVDYLRSNSRQLPKSNFEDLVPSNIIAQIRLWGKQLNRCEFGEAVLFDNFVDDDEFSKLKEKLIKSNDDILLSDINRKWLLSKK
ncbi:RNA polymerase II transcription factor B 52 kDa subunit [Bonamia ostreae]|uniref:General transcription factor IIH subunit 4 n=1 Tax=Bonamia ostreae TaxID=126728 RepID=A0ABV2AIZ2_9EUKA